jgi:hypothetical protein
MKPEIEWVKCDENNECYEGYDAFWDGYWLSLDIYEESGVIVAGLGVKADDDATIRRPFGMNELEEAKAWCESQLPHLIAMEICDET